MKKQTKPVDKTLEFARNCYADKGTAIGTCLLQHCILVSQQAALIGEKLYQDVRADFMPDSTKDSLGAISQGALLHEVLNVSACAFEHIAEIATVQIAAMVADISRDYRLVETKRDMEFRGRLSQSPVAAQIIVTADIICMASDMLKLLEKQGLVAVPKVKKLLTQLDGDLLAIHAANRYYILRLYVHAARNMLSDVSQRIKDCKHQAKLDKIVAQSTRSLREAVAQKEAKAKKKKELRYAEKRNFDSDPE